MTVKLECILQALRAALVDRDAFLEMGTHASTSNPKPFKKNSVCVV